MSIAHVMCQKNSRSSISSGLFLRIARNLYESTRGRYSQPSFHPRIHSLTALEGDHNRTAKFPMPGTEVFMKVYPLSHPFPHFAQPCLSWSLYCTFSYCSFSLCLCSLSRLYSRSYYSCEKAAGVNLKSSLRGKGSTKNGRGTTIPSCTFFDLFPRSGYRCWHLRLIFIRYLDSRLLVA